MKNIFKKKSLFLISAILVFFLSFSHFSYVYVFIWFFSIVAMFPLFEDVIKKLLLKKISLKLPLIITLVILLYLKNSTTASIFLILILLGGIFKDYIIWRVEDSIRSLSKKLPDEASIRRDGLEQRIKIKNIQAGDILLIKDGGRVSTDGILLSDSAQMDESIITGESKIIKKEKNDTIIAGSILMGGFIEVRATKVYAESTVSQIENLVRNSQKEQARLSSFTTKYASYTIFFTLVAMLVYFLIERNILQALALWIALVPVIFAIIVPIATTIGISILAQKNILVKNAQILENLIKVDIVLFDKTGTLTEGKPELTDIFIFDKKFSEKDILRILFSLEKLSEHPFARAVVKKAQLERIEPLTIQDFKAIKGKGLSGLLDGDTIHIGDFDFMKELGVSMDTFIKKKVESFEMNGKSVFYISYNLVCIAIVSISDPIKENVKEMISYLHRHRIETVMLTGDNELVAKTIAHKLSIKKVFANLRPEDKNIFVKDFQKRGKKVLMVGDGVNDAPALAQADVGLAMGKYGIGLTIDSADIILPQNNILRIPYMINVAKRVFSIIKLDLWVATLIHIITAIFVVFGTIGVLGSTILHQFSSLFVLVNTLRTFKVGDNSGKEKLDFNI